MAHSLKLGPPKHETKNVTYSPVTFHFTITLWIVTPEGTWFVTGFQENQ